MARAQFVSCCRFVSVPASSGGRASTAALGLPTRLRRHFHAVNAGTMSPATLEAIFGAIISARCVW